MKNLSIILITLLQLSILGCATTQPIQELPVLVPPETKPTATPVPTTPVVDPGVVAGEVKFSPVEYYTTASEKVLIGKAQAKANEVKNSDCYFNFIANRKMIQTQGNTNTFVAKQIRALNGTVPVEFYFARFTSARAYRSPPSKTIHLNRKFIGTNSELCDVAGTILHESLHALLEYDHDFEWSPSREFSVPYSSDHAFADEAYSQSNSGGCCKAL